MNLQREVAKTGKPIDIIKALIDAEKNGGAKGQIKIATGWPQDNFDLVLSYDNQTQVYYAQRPVDLEGEEETSLAEVENQKKDQGFVDKISHITRNQKLSEKVTHVTSKN